MLLVAPDNAILHNPCRPDFIIYRTDIEEMFALMYEYRGLGLAAPQVGINARLFVTNWGEIFINPGIVELYEPRSAVESCLSLPGVQVTVQRWNQIRLADGRVYVGQQAIVIQHECDHLDGCLITDRKI